MAIAIHNALIYVPSTAGEGQDLCIWFVLRN